MATPQTTTFVTSRAEYEANKSTSQHVVYTAALHLPQEIEPICLQLRELSSKVNLINVLNPYYAFKGIRQLRNSFEELQPSAQTMLSSCLHRMAEPVEGTSVIEIGWIQGFTFSAGMSAYSNLSSSISSVTECLDRKAAYTMACFSLYVAVVSLVATVVLGLLSLK